MNSLSGFLFATPSFMEGAARVLDIGGTFDQYNASDTEAEADEKAIYADWRVIGDDLSSPLEVESEKSPRHELHGATA